MGKGKLNVGVLVSGSGTNLQAIIDAAANGLPVEVSCVVASRPDAYGIVRAKEAGIPTLVLTRDDYADPAKADERIVSALVDAGAEYVVMAGYMRKVTPVLIECFPRPRFEPAPGAAAVVQGRPCHKRRLGGWREGDGRHCSFG